MHNDKLDKRQNDSNKYLKEDKMADCFKRI